MRFAEPEQLYDRLGRVLTGAETDRAIAALEDASALILSEAGSVDWDPEVEGSVPAIIETITLAVALRAIQNPGGAFTQAQVGDVSVSYSRDGGAASIFLTKDERSAIRRAAGRSANSVALAAPWDILSASSLYFVDTIDQNGNIGEPIPLGPWPWELP